MAIKHWQGWLWMKKKKKNNDELSKFNFSYQTVRGRPVKIFARIEGLGGIKSQLHVALL